jgi:hypothetical protein
MKLKQRFQQFREKHGKKALLIFLVYFVTKWTLTLVFGAKIFTWFQTLVQQGGA